MHRGREREGGNTSHVQQRKCLHTVVPQSSHWHFSTGLARKHLHRGGTRSLWRAATRDASWDPGLQPASRSACQKRPTQNIFAQRIRSPWTSPLAGSTKGHQDGIGTAARFDSTRGVTGCLDGGAIVTDGHRIRTVSAGGAVATFAADNRRARRTTQPTGRRRRLHTGGQGSVPHGSREENPSRTQGEHPRGTQLS